jgi:hypothetical protein
MHAPPIAVARCRLKRERCIPPTLNISSTMVDHIVAIAVFVQGDFEAAAIW